MLHGVLVPKEITGGFNFRYFLSVGSSMSNAHSCRYLEPDGPASKAESVKGQAQVSSEDFTNCYAMPVGALEFELVPFYLH